MLITRLFVMFVIVVFFTNTIFASYAAAAYSLTEIARISASDGPVSLPVISPAPETASPAANRDQAWLIADGYPAERFELEVLVESLEYEPMAAFEYVRDFIMFDPYPGVMRGSTGTLGAGAGNAHDRSLLLKELLDTMGFETRLVYGTLDDAQARSLLAHAARPGANRDGSSHADGRLVDSQKAFATAAYGAYRWLKAALGELLTHTKHVPASVDDIREHAWVQVKDGVEWQDLDSSFPDAQPGKAMVEVASYARQAPERSDYRARIAVIAETLQHGKFKEETLLEHEMDVLAAATSRNLVYFAPKGGGQGRALAAALGPDAQFLPILQVNEDHFSGKAVPGLSLKPEELSAAKEFFYGTDKSITTAVYISVGFSGPGRLPRAERHVVFDRVPGQLRSGGTVEVDTLSSLERSNGIPVAYQGIHQLLVSNGGANPRQVWGEAGYAAWLAERLREMGEDEMSHGQLVWQLGTMQMVYPLLSEGLTITALNDLPDARFFVGKPRVFVMTMTATGTSDQPQVSQSIDLLIDGIEFVSVGASAESITQRMIWYGVLQSALETASVASSAVASGYPADLVMSAFRSVGSETTVIASEKDLDPAARYPARLIDDLRTGAIVIHESGLAPGIATWWAVNPGDGNTRAMLAPAMGGANYSPGSTSYSYYGSGGTRTIGGAARGGGYYYINKDMTSVDLNKAKNVKLKPPRTPPPPSCRAGGTEYTTTLCGASVATIQQNMLIAANLGLVLLAVTLLMINQLKQDRKTYPSD